MKKIFILVMFSMLLFGCSNKKEERIKELMEEQDYIIVDVRTNNEYNESHLVDSINIPYDEIDENIKLDKDKLISVYCKSGNRSNIASQTLADLGYNIYDLGAYSKIDLPKE